MVQPTYETASAGIIGSPSLPRPSVLIVGGGLAGLCAAIEVYRSGVNVCLLEKEARVGGNSAKASSGINGVPTEAQKAAGVEDTVEMFYKDTEKSGGQLSVPRLIKVLTDSSKGAVEWLGTFDPSIKLTVLSQCGGHSRPRTHRLAAKSPGAAPLPIGFGLIQTLSNYLTTEAEKSEGRLRIQTSCTVSKLLVNSDGAVTGVRVAKRLDSGGEDVGDVECDAVVLCSGGYGASAVVGDVQHSLVNEFAPHVLGLPTTNGPWAQGDGIKLARDESIKAALVHMDQVQVHPTAYVHLEDPGNDTKFLAPEALRGHGGVLLNGEGRRFVNELGPRDYVTQTIFEKASGQHMARPMGLGTLPLKAAAFLVLSEKAVQEYDPATVGFYVKRGLIHQASDLDQLASQLSVDPGLLRDTFKEYDECVSGSKNDIYGKKVFPGEMVSASGGAYYWAVITPAIHYTMGGLEINSSAEVLNNNHQAIPHLFAAGEVTGGVHGKNRLAGNSLLECVVYGRIAGQKAASHVRTK
ncbi:Flavocytochrome c [Basidiobolus meristosporus CBS 931.73]|uniref:Fumarate reductase n=1 Tax=Basidiobolus meristosporus CBS 931.73 TaxID=1314790 RepID=A0A1Y1XZG4_9FUNG|nr:Flavocytochrome c [Basidiobolus meristosporus CBS 931.73]|eukprot:ORX91122.1 Flavocytochrome c [Basidiobolus meristosporus CBS 931.73]